MKYNALLHKKSLGYSYPFQYLKQLILTNIKTCYTQPKSILYSKRLNNGEKFLLSNKTLYPYNFKFSKTESDYSSTTLSLKIDVLFQEFQINEIEMKVQDEQLVREIIETYSELSKIIKYNKADEIDFPVAVIARYLYFSIRIKDLFKKEENSNDNDSNIKNLIDLFIKKIQYSDSESLGLFMKYLTLVNNNDSQVWESVHKRLSQVRFEPEFTKVTNYSPHLFQYKEIKEETFTGYSDFTVKVFFEGWRSVFYVYQSILYARRNGISQLDNENEFLRKFEKEKELFNDSRVLVLK